MTANDIDRLTLQYHDLTGRGPRFVRWLLRPPGWNREGVCEGCALTAWLAR